MDRREKHALKEQPEAQPELDQAQFTPDPDTKQPSEDKPAKPQPWRYNLYARIPLKLRTVDIIIGVTVALLIITLAYGLLTRGS